MSISPNVSESKEKYSLYCRISTETVVDRIKYIFEYLILSGKYDILQIVREIETVVLETNDAIQHGENRIHT